MCIKMEHLKARKRAQWVKCWLCKSELSPNPKSIGKTRHGDAHLLSQLS